jgi:hypothetical protein
MSALLILILALVAGLAVLVLAAFVAVVIGIHSEPRRQIATRAQGPLAVLVRRLLGVYVGRPTGTAPEDNREDCLTGSSADWWNKDG